MAKHKIQKRKRFATEKATPWGKRQLEDGRRDRTPEYRLNIDGDLFRRQREMLLNIAAASQGAQAELLEGLNCMLDTIADQAHDAHGIDCLLKASIAPPKPAGLPPAPLDTIEELLSLTEQFKDRMSLEERDKWFAISALVADARDPEVG